jgi:hypothetical protein
VTHIETSEYTVDLEWDGEGKPVLYGVLRGKINIPKDAVAISTVVVQIINANPFDSVCVAYDTLGLGYLPMLPKFINAGNYPSSPKTSHIIICTNNQAIRLIGSVIAAVGSHKLRTFEACKTLQEMQQAVKHWLTVQERARIYTIPDI